MIKKLLQNMPASVIAKLDRADAAQGKPFDRPQMMKPHLNHKFYGWTHYGVMIPDLPAPHRFFSIMSVIGTPGALAFDVDHALKTNPRNNATLVSGTAATHPNHFSGYDIPKDCVMHEDGSHIQFGNELTISGTYPRYNVNATWKDFELSLDLDCTDKVSWFVKNPVYEHLSLLTKYKGNIKHKGEVESIQGLCTFEYACCPSPYVLRNQPLPPALKLPLDFFTYQIVNLADNQQLLLTQARIKGVPIITAAYLRSCDAYSTTYRETEFTVLEYQNDLLTAPDGVQMRIPRVFRWDISDGGAQLMTLTCTVDTPMTYGLGSGYVGGFYYEGKHQGKPIHGNAYIEYIDRRA